MFALGQHNNAFPTCVYFGNDFGPTCVHFQHECIAEMILDKLMCSEGSNDAFPTCVYGGC